MLEKLGRYHKIINMNHYITAKTKANNNNNKPFKIS